jgi:hypothetical protein
MKTIEKLIDLVENTKPKCTLGIDTEVYFKDEDGVIESYGCELTLCWFNQDYEVSITAPYCTISPPYKRTYDLETFEFGSTPLDCACYTNGQHLSPDEEELIETVMRDRLYRYVPTQDGCVIEHI